MVQGGAPPRPGAAELLAILSARLSARGQGLADLPAAQADKLAAALEELGFSSAVARAKLRKALLSKAVVCEAPSAPELASERALTAEPVPAVQERAPEEAAAAKGRQPTGLPTSHLAHGWLRGPPDQRKRAPEEPPAPAPVEVSALRQGLAYGAYPPRRCRPSIRGQDLELLRERVLAKRELEAAAPRGPPGAGVTDPCVRCGQQRSAVASDGKGYCDLCLPLWEAGTSEAQGDFFRDVDTAEDSDGETLGLCSECRLPLGEFAYSSGKDATLHGECLAQLVFRELRAHEDGRQRVSADRKRTSREEHDIGWRPGRVPRSLGLASKLGCKLRGQQSLCCLVFDEGSHSVSVDETAEPAARVNLEYLAFALEVRRSEGREPLFSLDSTDPSRDPSTSMQVKRFEPRWLEGTSVGDVLFQADYYLKELSMGEHRQPVVGMRSCFEMSETGVERDSAWNAREWFVVKKAEVCISADGVLVPRVEMGVEAREQIVGEDGLQDKLITRLDHPLVRYADAFTRNFDLIAERLSVVHHLRELAKATVLAKFLLDQKLPLGDAWFAAAGGQRAEAPAAPGRVPQLSRERCRTQIRVEDGALLGQWEGPKASYSSVSGGVNLGLQSFPTTSRKMPVSLAGASAFQFGQGRASIMALSGAAARGVDLCLERFDLSVCKKQEDTDQLQMKLEEAPKDGELLRRSCPVAGGELVALLRGESEPADGAGDDIGLLRAVFNPLLADRLAEGDDFVGPDTSEAYRQRLRSLVREEEKARRDVEARFLSPSFDASAPGPGFPESWTSPIQIARPQLPRRLRPLPAGSASLESVRVSEPVFDQRTEDGLRFRIYRQGGLEARTTQPPGGPEAIGAAFAVGALQDELPGSDRIFKVTKCVTASASTAGAGGAQAAGRPRPRYCLLLETQSGDVILSERLPVGGVSWEENPETLEPVVADAKVLGSIDCRKANITVRNMRELAAALAGGGGGAAASASECKRYAHGAYNWARSQARCVPSVVQRALDGLGAVRWGPAASILPPRGPAAAEGPAAEAPAA